MSRLTPGEHSGEESAGPNQASMGIPSEGKLIPDRFETEEIFERILAAADEEMGRGNRELFFSALAGGFSITITFLLYATLTAKTGGHPILSSLLYPLGFIYIILGGYQLYTENTLPPVTLVLERLASVPALLRIWIVVLLGNFLGGGLGALSLAGTGVFDPKTTEVATRIAMKGIETPFWPLFFKAGFAGLIVAGVVWIDYSARDTTARFFLVYLAFLAIPLGDLYHSVVSFTELTYLVVQGEVAFLYGFNSFVLPVILGNTIGGVVLVTVVNYFQTTASRVKVARKKGLQRQLTPGESLLGGLVGRSYVPVEYGDGGEAE